MDMYDWISIAGVALVVYVSYRLLIKLDNGWNVLFRDMTSGPDDRYRDRLTERMGAALSQDIYDKLEQFKKDDPDHVYEVRVQNPTNKVITENNRRVDYNETIMVFLKNTSTGFYTSCALYVFDEKYRDTQDMVDAFNALIDSLIQSHISTEYVTPAW